jgi:hypothetical protein
MTCQDNVTILNTPQVVKMPLCKVFLAKWSCNHVISMHFIITNKQLQISSVNVCSVEGKIKFVVRNVLPHQMPVLAAIKSKNHTSTQPTPPPPHTHTHTHTRACVRMCAHIQGENNKLALAWRDCGKHQNCLSQESWPPMLIFRPRTSQLRCKSATFGCLH